MGAHLITGYAGKAHITSGDTGMFNAAIIGGGKYVLPIGSMFEASIVTNNLVKVMDGCMVNQGRNINIPVNDYEECIIDNGLQGLKRNDLIVIRYSKDVETEIEKAETIVIKGVSGDTAVDPSYLTGDILSGAATDDFPLYRVKLDGLNITALEPMFNVMVSMNSLKESLAKCETDLSTLNTNLDTITDIAFTSSKFTYARNELHKNNRTVYMSFNNHVSSLNSGDILATLPTSCIPCNGSWKIPLYDTNSELLGTLECYDNGNIKYNGNSITTERWIIATASWLTAN